MTPGIAALLDWAPAYVLVLARIGAAMVLMPGLSEAAAPAIVRAGLALTLSVLLTPVLAPILPPMPDAGATMALMIAGEVVTGLWFGWLARMIALALPLAAQLVAFLLGLSSVLQPDPELGPQSTAMARLFELAAPVIVLASGLYTVVLRALAGLFEVIPPGRMLPAGDSTQAVVQAVGTVFALALQIAAPFVVAAVVWNVVMGQVARVMGRVQIFFVLMPGQILGGLMLLSLAAGVMIAAWQHGAATYLDALPGAG